MKNIKSLIFDECLRTISNEAMSVDDIWEEKPVTPEVFFKEWLPPYLSEPQLDVFNVLFKEGKWSYEYLEYLLFWGEGCVAGSTLLRDEETGREYTIKELADNKKRITVKSIKVVINNKEYICNKDGRKRKVGKKYKIVNQKTNIPFKKGNTKLYKVKTKSGKEVIVSAEHKFYTKDGWKTLGSLKIGNKIAINSTTVLDKKIEKERRQKISNTMIKFDEIESIECIGEEDFYDLEIPETHNYIAQDIVHHNSGKDFICVRIILYTAYFLMCLRSPQKYFEFAETEPIDLVNVSLSGHHAKDVFFVRLTQAIKSVMNPNTGNNWFKEKGMDLRDGKDIQTTKVTFKKNIVAHSLNSLRYTGEGMNILLAVFDEVGEFKPNKAKELYENLWFTAESRWGTKDIAPFRIILISYLRDENDFMNYRWESTKEDKKVFRSKKCTWEVRPGKTREDYKGAFEKNPEEALRRLANELSGTMGNSFITHRAKIREHVNKNSMSPFIDNPFRTHDLNELQLAAWFKPYSVKELDDLINRTDLNEEQKKLRNKLKIQHGDAKYNIHIDLAKGKDGGDCAGFAMCHSYRLNPYIDESQINVYLDLVMQLKGKDGKEIDFERIRQFIYKLQDRGFTIAKVTLDGYQCLSGDTKIQLVNGSTVPIKDLVGKEPWIYSYTGKEIIPIQGSNIRKTGKKVPLYEITLDNNKKIKATKEHPFMLRSGEYRELKNLKIGDSLMPLYLKHKVISVKFIGYEDVYDMEVPKYHNFALEAGVFVHNSVDMIQLLNKREIVSEQLSVDKNDAGYQTLKELIYMRRLDYYEYKVLLRELEELKRIENGKIDHPDISRKRALEENDERGSKDTADAVAGCCMSALEETDNDSGDWVGVEL